MATSADRFLGFQNTYPAARQAIVEAAVQLVVDQGPRGKWTVTDVCRAAGVARPTFYVYFEGRQHVLTACLQVLMRKIVTTLNTVAKRDIREGMLEYAKLLRPGGGSLDADRNWGLLGILGAVDESEELRKDYAVLVAEVREHVIDTVIASQAAGTVDPTLDPRGVGGILTAVLFTGALFQQIGVPLRPTEVFTTLERILGPRPG